MENRRDFIKKMTATGLIGLFSESALSAAMSKRLTTPSLSRSQTTAPVPVRGPLPILSTPYLETGEVDYEVLANEARFVFECGCPGSIWPQSDDSCDLLSVEEKLKGMEALVKAMAGTSALVVLGCQGKNTAEMVVCAEHIQLLAQRYPEAHIAIISRPPDDGKTVEDLRNYYLELAKHITCPVIIQTGGGTTYRGVMPPVELLIELARLHPQLFGYIKEESGDCNSRIVEELTHKPLIKTVFSAWGSWQWLYQSRQLGTEGLITERPAYADLIAYIWEQMENGDAQGTLDDAFGRYLLMLNLSNSVPDRAVGGELRGPHLYLLKRRGIFKNCLSRAYDWTGGKRTIPQQMILKDLELSAQQQDEIERRFRSLKPYLRK